MKLTKKRIALFSVLFIVFALVFPYRGARFSSKPKVHEGDVIFQMSTSKQSPLIATATHSLFTHCGIIVMKNGEPYVLEASSTLKTTPLKDFIHRGRWGAYWLKRPKAKYVDRDNIKIKYGHLLGRSYDLAFSFDNNRYYCSELVYDIYKNRLGVELCKPRPMKSYFTLGMKRKMKQRGMDINSLVVAPSDLFSSKYLE